MTRPEPSTRDAWPHFTPLTTRWSDNDIYGHLNNVVYYSLFDSALNRYLIEAGVLDIHGGPVIGVMVESICQYFAPLAYPQAVDAGLRVQHIGRSSVRYGVALFGAGEPRCAASAELVHVYVDRATRRPVPLPDAFAAALKDLL